MIPEPETQAALEIARFIASQSSPEQVIAFRPSPAVIERAYALIDAERERSLTNRAVKAPVFEAGEETARQSHAHDATPYPVLDKQCCSVVSCSLIGVPYLWGKDPKYRIPVGFGLPGHA